MPASDKKSCGKMSSDPWPPAKVQTASMRTNEVLAGYMIVHFDGSRPRGHKTITVIARREHVRKKLIKHGQPGNIQG